MVLRARRPNGEAIELNSHSAQAVAELRTTLAEKLGVPAWCVQLLEEERMLEDETLVAEIASEEISVVVRSLAGQYEYAYRWSAGRQLNEGDATSFECKVRINFVPDRSVVIEATGFDKKGSYYEALHKGVWEPGEDCTVWLHFQTENEKQEWEITEDGHLELVQGSVTKASYRGGIWYGALMLRRQEPVFWKRGADPIVATIQAGC
eukprot:gb/GFBE01063958.1/.p1 GENE.gb/GFBE01063958.1/~~gb/GFBE01063958.1/.p1  ORF type:complete len:207 (+),score=53.28 gb/GFBE01063958.1/:1-621(+)